MGGAPGAWRAAHFCFKHFRKIILILNPHQCGNFADAAFGILQKQRGGLHPPFFDVARDADAEILLGNLKQAAAADIKDAAQLCGGEILAQVILDIDRNLIAKTSGVHLNQLIDPKITGAALHNLGGGTNLLKVDDALAAVDDFVASKLQ